MATREQDQMKNMDKSLDDLQKPRRVGTKVGLGVIHQDLEKLDKTLTAAGKKPAANRPDLPVYKLGKQTLDPRNPKEAKIIELIQGQLQTAEPEVISPEPVEQTKPVREVKTVDQVPDKVESDAERTDRLKRLGSVIGSKIGVERGGALNNIQTGINAQVFDKFVEQTKNREELLKGASDEQIRIFKELEETIIKLREADSKESQELRKTIAELSGQLKETPDSEAKAKIDYRLQTAMGNDRPANLGNVFKAAFGNERTLKAGYEREGNNIRDVKTGKFASRATAQEGRLQSTGKLLGQFIGNWAERDVEGHRSERFQGMLDRNFRSDQGERAAVLAGQQAQLTNATPGKKTILEAVTKSQGRPSVKETSKKSILEAVTKQAATKSPMLGTLAKIISPTAVASTPSLAPAAPDSSLAPAAPDSAKTINITAEKVMLSGAVSGAASAAPAGAAETAEKSGGILSTASDFLSSGGSKVTSMASNYLGKVGGLGTVAKGVGIGGLAAAAGSGIQAGGDYLKESGYEKTGKAVGTAGTAVKYAGYGAMIGSVIPGVGTAVGAGVGGLIGAGKGIYDQYFSDQPASSQVAARPGPGKGADIARKSSDNALLKTAAAAPIVSAANQPAIRTAAPAPSNSVVMPRGDLRPRESALERYTNRHSNFY